MKDKIFIVTHKKIDKQVKKPFYSYIQVNAKNNPNLNFEYNDGTGKNITTKNSNYCELTALYWIWKNYKCNSNDIIGLCHYRRFFTANKLTILNMKRIKKILNNYDIILPKKFHFPVTTYDFYFQYGAGKEKDLKQVRKIIGKLYPDYLEAFDWYCKEHEGHYCNMMICSKNELNKYCQWLFDILFELEKELDLSSYTQSEARIYGYLSELLINVYVKYNGLKVKEINMINTEISLFTKIKNKCQSIVLRSKNEKI